MWYNNRHKIHFTHINSQSLSVLPVKLLLRHIVITRNHLLCGFVNINQLDPSENKMMHYIGGKIRYFFHLKISCDRSSKYLLIQFFLRHIILTTMFSIIPYLLVLDNASRKLRPILVWYNTSLISNLNVFLFG